MPNNNKYAANQWKKGSGQPNLRDLRVPSGQLCQVRRARIEELFKQGVLSSVDQLSKIVSGTFVGDDGEVDMEKALADPEGIAEGFKVIDKVVAHVVVQPKVYEPVEGEERDPDRIYTDDIELEDRVFIFQFALGGFDDIDRFRAEASRVVGNMESSEDLEHTPIRATGDRG